MASIARSTLPIVLLLLVAQKGHCQGHPNSQPASAYYDTDPNQFNGVASNYGGPADGGLGAAMFGLTVGGCGYGDISNPAVYPRRAALAFDPLSPATAGLPSFGCGTCWKVTNPGNQWAAFIAMVTDICPGCNAQRGTPYAVDVDYLTWATVVPDNEERVTGTFPAILEQVNCRPSGSARIVVTDFTGPWNWIRLFPYQIAGVGAVSGISINCPYNIGGSWVDLENTFGAVWEAKRNKFPNYRRGTMCTAIITTLAQRMWVDFTPDAVLYRGGVIDSGTQFDGSYRNGPGEAWRIGRKLRGDDASLPDIHVVGTILPLEAYNHPEESTAEGATADATAEPIPNGRRLLGDINVNTGVIHARKSL